jgi:hypothetical protein
MLPLTSTAGSVDVVIAANIVNSTGINTDTITTTYVQPPTSKTNVAVQAQCRQNKSSV